LLKIDACTTRLRLEVADPQLINDAALKRLGARGVVRPGGAAVQVVVGPAADTLAVEIRGEVAAGRRSPASPPTVEDMFAAFGGYNNVLAVLARGSRLLLTPADRSRVDLPRLQRLFPRGVVFGYDDIHVLIGPNALGLAETLMRRRASQPTIE